MFYLKNRIISIFLLADNLNITLVKNKFVAKIVLLGDGAVGKTSLKRRFIYKTFDPLEQMTIGADFARITLELKDFQIVLQIWDIAGQARYKEIASSYYSGAKGAMIAFDVTRESTFQSIPKWISVLVDNAGKIPFMLVGNKIDLVDQRVVSRERGEEYAKQLSKWLGWDVPYIETSAKTGENVEESFLILANNVLDVALNNN